MPFPFGPLITAVGAIGSGLINHFSNKNLTNNAYKQNVQMWHEQNAYNSPASQVARLRSAGLNPALAYGASGQVVGNSESAPQLDYGGVMNQPLIRPDFSYDAVQAMNLDSQRRVNDSVEQKNRAETVESLYRGVLSGARAGYAKEYALEELRSMRLQNDKVYKECEYTDQAINNLIATRNLTREQISSLMYANEFANRTMEYRIEATQLQNEATRKSFQKIESEISKYKADTSFIFQKVREQVITNGMLPQILQNNFEKGQEEINNLKKTGFQIQATIDKIASETGINKTELQNWFWLNAPGLNKLPGAVAGAMTDKYLNQSFLNNIPSYNY